MRMPANAARGEFALVTTDGAEIVVCLDMNTLAALEAEFEVPSFATVFATVLAETQTGQPSATTMLKFGRALMAGAGLDPEDAAKVKFASLVAACGALVQSTGLFDKAPPDDPTKAKPNRATRRAKR